MRCLRNSVFVLASLFTLGIGTMGARPVRGAEATFEGQFFGGEGDVEYLKLLDIARRMFEPDAEFQNLAMLYTPDWNGLVEGPKWGMWWIQNSYGPSYCAMPFYIEPAISFLQNSQAAWFTTMGDGKRTWKWGNHEWVVPDGQLCDAATPSGSIPKQGDGRVDIHDWGMEFTAAGTLMQAELLLIGRDPEAIAHYLPMLERCAEFIESRRDPKNNLFLAGPAGNLLAPNYAGWKKPDGTYDKAYLAGLSITYIAALDRLIELEKLAGHTAKAELYSNRRDLARKGLPLLTTDEGYFLKYIDPDGTKHGVYGAEKHGYFAASPNHDAICFRIADDAQARRIYDKIASIPLLRRNTFIISNQPSLDDMYEDGGIFSFGTWINGGHWSTCEARMITGYYRVGQYEDARKSMQTLLTFARRFQLDNPLKDFGATPWFDSNPTNLCYDALGPPAAMVRGLFEYIYRADGLTLIPHLPPGITRLEQRFPIRFGTKRLYLATSGAGRIQSVSFNGKPWKSFTDETVFLPYEATPDNAAIEIVMGDGKTGAFRAPEQNYALAEESPEREAAFLQSIVPPVLMPNELPLRIGSDSTGANRFVGEIARAQVFGEALGPEAIAELAQGMTDRQARGASSPVGDWTFERRRGEAFPNASGDGLEAEPVGKVEVVDSPHGKAVRLGTEGYLEVKHDTRLNLTDAVTLAAWIRPTGMQEGGARILDKGRIGSSEAYMLDTHPGNALRLLARAGVVAYDAKLAPGQWAHVAGTVAPDGAMALYLNGKQVATSRPSAEERPEQDLPAKLRTLRRFHAKLVEAGLADSYEAAHARFAVSCFAAGLRRKELDGAGKIAPLSPAAQFEAYRAYATSAAGLCEGLEKVLESYANCEDAQSKRVYAIWQGL